METGHLLPRQLSTQPLKYTDPTGFAHDAGGGGGGRGVILEKDNSWIKEEIRKIANIAGIKDVKFIDDDVYISDEIRKKARIAEARIPGFVFNETQYFLNDYLLENQIQMYLILSAMGDGLIEDGNLSLMDSVTLEFAKFQLKLAFTYLNRVTEIENLFREDDLDFYYSAEEIDDAVLLVECIEFMIIAGAVNIYQNIKYNDNLKAYLEFETGVSLGNNAGQRLSTKTGVRKASYKNPDGGGGITSKLKVGDKTITFGHGGRHLKGTNLSIEVVNRRIANEIVKIHPGTGQFYKGQIKIDGIIIEYTSFGLEKGVINIGTYYPIN